MGRAVTSFPFTSNQPTKLSPSFIVQTTLKVLPTVVIPLTNKSIVASDGKKDRFSQVIQTFLLKQITYGNSNSPGKVFFTGFPLFPGGNRSRLIKKHLGLKMTYEFDCEFVPVFPRLRTTLRFRKRKKHSSWACLRPPKNVKLGFFTSQSCSDGKDMYKKAPRTCKVIVLLYKPTTCLVTSSLPSLMSQIPKAPCCHYWHNKISVTP